MKYYVIVFDRDQREIVNLEEFNESREALKARFKREIDNPGSTLEIVVLGAENEEALKRTHSRYFGDIQEFTSA
jgi:hypothetical protein